MKVLFFVALVSVVLLRGVWFAPRQQEKLLQEALGKSEINFSEMQQMARAFVATPPTLTELEKKRAGLGKSLFFDPSFSANGKIACASCHKPEHSFTDALPKAVGLKPRDRNTPTLINSFSSFWFYWDGRTDSLASQALNPLEDPSEHGFSRAEVAHEVFKKYRTQYESLFGNLSESFIKKLPPKARDQRDSPPVSEQVIRWAMVSTVSPKLIREIGSQLTEISTEQVAKYREKIVAHPKKVGEEYEKYQRLSERDKRDLNLFFANIGLSLEAYEKSLVALNSPFDAFIDSWINSAEPNPQKHFSKKFGFQEFLGFQVFVGKGNCQLCHTGSHFRDNQFHNIGLPPLTDILDLGRSQGILTVKADPFNCKGVFLNETERAASESCQDIPYLNSETPEAIGAFKTPTLRNIAETAPYMHDGRFSTLRQVIDHYNRMETFSGVGFREETLKPLQLTEREVQALESFLKSLSSPIQEIIY